MDGDAARGAAIANAATPAIASFVPEVNVCSLRRHRFRKRMGGVQTVPYHVMTRTCRIREFRGPCGPCDCVNSVISEKSIPLGAFPPGGWDWPRDGARTGQIRVDGSSRATKRVALAGLATASRLGPLFGRASRSHPVRRGHGGPG